MNTHDQKTKDHIRAIALAFAEDPTSIQFTGRGDCDCDLSELHSAPFSYSIKPKPTAPGHNPDKLTVDQVGEGWRLLDADEIKDRKITPFIEFWSLARAWVSGDIGKFEDKTYRTRLSREQLALLDKNEGWIPWFGEGEIPIGEVQFSMREEGAKPNLTEYAAKDLDWAITNKHRDIIAYRPAKQPTVVPWNRETIPTLPFEVRSKSTGYRYCVLGATETQAWIGNHGNFDYNYLLERFTLPNGEPCGVKGEK